jgi:hypothetical protein
MKISKIGVPIEPGSPLGVCPGSGSILGLEPENLTQNPEERVEWGRECV